jgi:hypothetical protein
MNSIFTALLFIASLSSFSHLDKNDTGNEALVKSYIEARNNYKTSKIITLIDENYKEIFSDGTLEIRNVEHLKEYVLFQKEMESKVRLISLESTDDIVTTIEEYSSYIDIALERKLRKFQIIYTFKNGRILSQKIIPLKGHKKITKFNNKCWKKLIEFCDINRIEFESRRMNYEMAVNLRKALDKYLDSKK